jgi:hypothetical protein
LKRISVLIGVVVIMIAFGTAAAWLQHLHSTPRTSEFDCLTTAHDGWLTISEGQASVHVDWQSGVGRLDGFTTESAGTSGEPHARTVALDLVSPLKGKPSGSAHAAKVNIFAMCDGVPRWWSGITVTKPTLRECVSRSWKAPRALVQCVRDVASAPAPAPTTSEAYDVAVKLRVATGTVPPEEIPDRPEPFFVHPRGPAPGASLGDTED